MNRSKLVIAAWLAAHSALSPASPAEAVIRPDIEAGEREIELGLGSARDGDGEHSDALVLSFGAGLNERWATEIGIEFERERGQGLRYEALEWENRLGVLVDEDAPLSLSVLLGIERPRERDEGWQATLGLLTEWRIGRSLLHANLLAERGWGAKGEESSEDELDADDGGTELGYQWQWLYRHSHRIHYGLHGMGEFGRWNDWAETEEQVHSLGPAIFGRVKLGGGRKLNYDAGLLLGLTRSSPDYGLRLKLEFEL